MVKRIAAILLIFACTSVAWMILGSTIFLRTHDADSSLRGVVASNWGSPQDQGVPFANLEVKEKRTEEVLEGKRKQTRVTYVTVLKELPLEAFRRCSRSSVT